MAFPTSVILDVCSYVLFNTGGLYDRVCLYFRFCHETSQSPWRCKQETKIISNTDPPARDYVKDPAMSPVLTNS